MGALVSAIYSYIQSFWTLPARFTVNPYTHSSMTIEINGDKIIFGKYPKVPMLQDLARDGFQIVNLTSRIHDNENIYYPIPDESVPKNGFLEFLTEICAALNLHHRVFIHCDHGRGRSGLVVAALLGYHYHISHYFALKIINQAHRLGRSQGANKYIPTHKEQLEFLQQFFQDLNR